MIKFLLILVFSSYAISSENIEDRRGFLQEDSYFDELQEVDRKGVHKYKVKSSDIKAHASLKIGMITPPQFESDIPYSRIYDSSLNFLTLLNYEFFLFQKLGRMSLDLGTGLMFASGQGIFDPEGINSYLNRQGGAREVYFLFIMPLNLGITYKLQYWKQQFVYPYASCGVSMFNILELRDDKIFPHVLVMPSTYFAFGVMFNVDFMSGSAVNHLEKDYGVNHMYILAEFRQHLNITTTSNLTNSMILAGVGFDF